MLSGDQPTMTYIRECLDTGEEFDLARLLGKSSHEDDKKSSDTQDPSPGADASNSPPSSALLSPRGSTTSDLKPQIARPVSIMNGIPPKAATFGLGENRGIHSMAEVLLRFLESLREPVVPTEMYYQALEVAGNQKAAYGLLDLMPPVHVNVFVYITSFLRELILIGGGSSGAGGAGAGGAAGSKDSGNGVQAPHSGASGAGAQNNGGAAVAAAAGSNSPALGHGNHRVMQSSSGSIYNGNDAASISGRGKDDENYRVAKLGTYSRFSCFVPLGAWYFIQWFRVAATVLLTFSFLRRSLPL